MKTVKLVCDDLLVDGEQKNFMSLIRLTEEDKGWTFIFYVA